MSGAGHQYGVRPRIRADVELPEVYALLVATSRATGVEQEVRDRMLAIVFDGLRP